MRHRARAEGRKENRDRFTAGYFCEGGPTFLDALKAHGGKASFFMMSAAVRTTDAASKCADVMPRLVPEGHYVGLHSETHPDMATAQGGPTLVTRARFDTEVTKHADLLKTRGVPSPIRYWMPPSETYNDQIAAWSAEDNPRTVFMTESVLTRGDYLAANVQNGKFTASAIASRILDVEARDPKGLNGAILFFHLGVGTARSDADKFHHAFPGVLDKLAAKGYSFVRIDELLDPVMGTTH